MSGTPKRKSSMPDNLPEVIALEAKGGSNENIQLLNTGFHDMPNRKLMLSGSTSIGDDSDSDDDDDDDDDDGLIHTKKK